jgi:ATP-dependent Clp protease adaptor protein ClpS
MLVNIMRGTATPVAGLGGLDTSDEHRRTRTSATDTGTVTEIDPDQATEVDRPWVVIVWNDPINLMSYVTWVLQKLFGYSVEKATELMLDVHHKGRAAVAEGTREQAEMHVFRLHEHGLWATMEHDR